MYGSTSYLREFYRRALEAVAAQGFSRIEFVFVNDGSPDDSLATALALQREDPRIRVVDLSRNFGHHYAILAGLEHSRGELIFLIDSDLEESPEDFGKLLQALRTEDADLAYGVQLSRKGGLVERWGGALAFQIIAVLAGELHWPRNMMVSRIMTRRYLLRFIAYGERTVVFPALSSLVGFRQVAIPLVKLSKGSTTYSIGKRINLFLHIVTEFSHKPLLYIAYLGATITAASVAFVAYLAFNYLTRHSVPEGYTSLAVSIWLLGGLCIFSVGIVALYLSVIFVEVKSRPRYVVRGVHELGGAPDIE